jgi:hypothetical protein
MRLTRTALTSFLFLAQATAWTTARASSRSAGGRNFVVGRLQQSTAAASSISTSSVGQEATESFRLQFQQDAKQISPWHDIPFQNEDGSYNMVRAYKRRSMNMSSEYVKEETPLRLISHIITHH